MGRFPARERWLAYGLMLVWALVFSFSVDDVVRDAGVAPFFVAAAEEPGGYPSIASFRPYVSRGQETEVAVGDRLIRAGEVDLRGASPLRVFVHVAAQREDPRHTRLVYEREGAQRETLLELSSLRNYAGMLPTSLVLVLCALAAFLRAAPTPLMRIAVPALLLVAIEFSSICAGSVPETIFAMGARTLALSFDVPLILYTVMRLPQDDPPRTWWGRFGPWVFLPRGLLALGAGYGAFAPALSQAVVTFSALAIGPLFIWIFTRNYLRADPIGRRQLKWVLLAAYVALVPILTVTIAAAADPGRILWVFNSLGALSLIPIGLLIGVLRYNLFDIDRLISATASYTILAVVGIAAVLTLIPWLAERLSDVVGLAPASGQLVLSVLFAAGFVPLHRRMRPQIDRMFFVERYALEQGVQRLLEDLSTCHDAGELTGRAGEGLDRLLRPESVAIYARGEGDVYSAVFARGNAVPPGFAAGSPLVSALEDRAAPLSAEAVASGQEALSPFDRAALETLGVPVIVPVRRGETLVAFVCLGPKRSRDVYTSTDLTLLTAVADKVSSELLRFDQEDVIRDGRAMQERLRRYVPEAVADELAGDRELEPGERQVSVLFVDIRGYSRYAEQHAGAQVFSTLNQYTEIVSNAVGGHGGSVVEFSGDGMMAVFGAPRELESKELAAVEAGRAILDAVVRIDSGGEGRSLSVGVGIATGEAFVGTIRSADRHFWSAIGNTTNLASRLQGLTRDLDVAMVIDGETWEQIGAAAADFECRPELAIRGRSDSQDVYVLPLDGDEALPASEREGDWTGRVLGGRYRVERPLGSGGMGSAWLAMDRRLEREMVVKVPHEALLLRPGYRERFAREVRHLTRVSHPHIVSIHDVGEFEKLPYAVVQYLGGGDLAERVREAGGRVPAEQIAAWLPDVAAALDHVHASGSVHRDVKPDNILFDEQGHVFLSDFGIATTMDEDAASSLATPLTQPGAVLGALSYAPPEAIDRVFSPAYDQYCLGTVVFEALCGVLPFEGTSPEAALLAKLGEPPRSLAEQVPELPEALCAAVMRTLERDREARFPSCGAFAEAFRSAAS